MSIRNLNRLFQPRSVAVIGASPNKSSIGKIVLSNLVDEAFRVRSMQSIRNMRRLMAFLASSALEMYSIRSIWPLYARLP